MHATSLGLHCRAVVIGASAAGAADYSPLVPVLHIFCIATLIFTNPSSCQLKFWSETRSCCPTTCRAMSPLAPPLVPPPDAAPPCRRHPRSPCSREPL